MSMHMGKLRVVADESSPDAPRLPAGRYKLLIDSQRLSFIAEASRRDGFLALFFLGLGIAIGMPFWPGRSSWAQVAVQFAALIGGVLFLVIWLRSNPKSRAMVQHIPREDVRSLEETGAGLRLHLNRGAILLQASPEIRSRIQTKLASRPA